MSATGTDVDDVDRLGRVTLSRTIEPGDLRVTGLVSELGVGKVLGYLEAAGDVESHWGFALAQELVRLGADTSGDLAGSLLHAAVHVGDVEMTAWVISLGASIDALDYEGKTPLQRAEASGNPEMIHLLQKAAGTR